MISAYRPIPLKINRNEAKQVMLNSCHLQALAEDSCYRKPEIVTIQDMSFSVEEANFGDPLEDKVNTKRRFACNYRCANACNTPVTKGLSALPFKPLTDMT